MLAGDVATVNRACVPLPVQHRLQRRMQADTRPSPGSIRSKDKSPSLRWEGLAVFTGNSARWVKSLPCHWDIDFVAPPSAIVWESDGSQPGTRRHLSWCLKNLLELWVQWQRTMVPQLLPPRGLHPLANHHRLRIPASAFAFRASSSWWGLL